MALLAILVLLLVVATPIIAIIALVRTATLQKAVNEFPELLRRLHEVEWSLVAMDQRLKSLGGGRTLEPGRQAAAPPEKVKSPEPISEAPRPTVPAPGSTKPFGAQIPSSTTVPETIPAPPSSTGPAPPQPPAPPRDSAPLSSQRGPSEEDDVESTIAGRWFNYVGILATVVAISFFLKYAFDNNWIGPVGRVSIGILVGAALYPLSHWSFKRGYTYYAEGITALGAAVLYLSVWAGWHYYHIFSQGLAFPLTVAITALTVAVALGRNSERIAVLALAGGLLTPILVSTGQNAEISLFSYLLALGGGMLAIAALRKWRSIAPLMFAGVLVYFWGWYAAYYYRSELGTTVLFATLFFVLFAALPAVRSTREGELSSFDIGIVISNAFQYLIALRLMLWPEHRWGLTFSVLALAGAHLLAERALPRKYSSANRVARVIYDGLALTFATLAIPIRLEGKWITIAFAAEGLVLIWSGLRVRLLALRAAGLALFVIVGVRLVMLVLSAPAPRTFLLNERFLTLAVCAACWLGAYFLARNSRCELDEGETQLYFSAAVAANFCFLLALSMDVWDWFGRMPTLGADHARAQELALSVLWVLYALALIVAGSLRKSAAVRWQGLALLSLTVGKAFLFDLSFLTRFYRIVSFLVLGLVLLAVSFFYQKRSKARAKAKLL